MTRHFSTAADFLFSNEIRYINLRFTYLLTYVRTCWTSRGGQPHANFLSRDILAF